jgi:hypothetical protein
MSHTDKDRPYWVRVADESRVIDHDHRDGTCIVSNDRRDRWGAFRHHYRDRCKKYELVEWTCTKDDPYVDPNRWYLRRAYGLEATRSCWRSFLDEYGRWRSVQCVGHSKWVRHEDWPCTCDARSQATCFPAQPDDWNWSAWGGGGVPRWFVRAVWTGPQRRRERDGLRARARAFNAGERDDLDFENEQHRHGARWDWH